MASTGANTFACKTCAIYKDHIDGLVQEIHNSIANALELHFFVALTQNYKHHVNFKSRITFPLLLCSNLVVEIVISAVSAAWQVIAASQ